MVLESLFNPFVVKKKPWEMFFAGFFYSLIALFLSYMVFKEAAGLLAVFLIVISTLPILYTTIRKEEELDEKYNKEWWLLKEHTKVLIFLIFLFLGITTALAGSYVFLPKNIVDVVFGLQQDAIINVNQNVRLTVTGNITRFDLFTGILFNNLKVLFFCLVFSFLYGTGALFILTWNASVVATAMGNLFKIELAKGAKLVGLSSFSAYFSAASFSFLRYMTHGIFEMVAYFVAGLAGGIISIALIKHRLEDERVLIDSLYLIALSIGILFIAGLIEVYVSQVLFS